MKEERVRTELPANGIGLLGVLMQGIATIAPALAINAIHLMIVLQVVGGIACAVFGADALQTPRQRRVFNRACQK